MRVYSRMLLEGVRPDPHTYVTVLNVCIALRDLKHGKGVHSCVKSQGLDSDPILATALLNMYGKCNSLGDASETFETLQRKDLICWNAMLAAYTQNDQGGEAFRLFHRMLQEGVKLDKFTLTTMVVCLSTLQEVEFMSSILKENPAIERSSFVLGNTLITMYGKHRRIDGCKSTFDRMNNRNVITWTSLIGAYVENGLFLEALLLYYNMNLEGFKPNEITYVSVLDACFNSGDLRQGRAVHAAIVSSCVELDCFLETAIVNMYGKCGSLETARKVFEQMHEMDIVTWTSIIGSHAQHGRGQEAMEFFHRMELQGVIPNSVTFVIFISACSHAGLVEEALVYFSSMIGDYSIPPEEQHCLCIVDLLARSGRVEEAERFVEKMPFKAQSVAWTTLLTACKVTGTGTNVAKDLFRNGQESGKCGPYVTLATTLKSQLVYECQTTNHVNL